MGETRVDLLHLLEDLRDAYPEALEETILTEVVANALDSGATEIGVTADLGACSLRFTAISNRNYSVLFRETLPGSPWLKLVDVPARTTNRVAIVPDTATNGQRFYRLITPSVP